MAAAIRSFVNANAWALIVTVFLAGGAWVLLLGKADASEFAQFKQENAAGHAALAAEIGTLAKDIKDGQANMLYLLCRQPANTGDSACDAARKASPSPGK